MLNFNRIKWESPSKGVQQKIMATGNKQLRLIRFEDNFVEKDWCTKSHYGFITDGEMKIDFNDKITSFNKGDALIILENDKHKAIIEKGKFVEIILFE